MLAGCLGSSADPDGAQAGAPPALAAAAGDGALTLTDCVGMLVYADYPVTGPAGPRPAGWPASSRPDASVGIEALRCERVSLGPFERGPVHLALDWHNDAVGPASCGVDEGSTANVLGTLWLDDAALAAHLRDAFAAPAFESPVDEGATELAAGRWNEWAWGADGDESRLAVLSDGLRQQQQTQHFRAFWPAGDGVGRLELDWTALGSTADRPAQGSMRAPMLARDFTGLGQWIEEVEASGTLTLFENAACKVDR